MKQEYIFFKDASSSDGAMVIVKKDDAGSIGLCLSLDSDGDVEIYMCKDDARKVFQALGKALDES